MSAVLVALADGLADEINAHNFDTTFEFEAERTWGDKDDELAELEALKVEVVPIRHDSSILKSRGTGDVEYEPVANIIIRYKFKANETEENGGRIDKGAIDSLALLAEQIIEFLYHPDHLRLASYPEASISQQKPIVPQTIAPRNYLREHRMFLAVLTVTYDIVKEA